MQDYFWERILVDSVNEAPKINVYSNKKKIAKMPNRKWEMYFD